MNSSANCHVNEKSTRSKFAGTKIFLHFRRVSSSAPTKKERRRKRIQCQKLASFSQIQPEPESRRELQAREFAATSRERIARRWSKRPTKNPGSRKIPGGKERATGSKYLLGSQLSFDGPEREAGGRGKNRDPRETHTHSLSFSLSLSLSGLAGWLAVLIETARKEA